MRLLIIFAAMVVAVAVGVVSWLATSQRDSDLLVTPEPISVAVEEATILVARKNVPVGKRITEDDIDRQPWPKHLVLDEFYFDGSDQELINQVARTPILEREPFARGRLANPSDPSFLAAQLPKGMRAVTIPVDAVTGVGGFVFPGDRVDVVTRQAVGLEQDYLHPGDVQQATTPQGSPISAQSSIPLPIETTHKVPVLMMPAKHAEKPVIHVTEVLVANARVLAVGRQSSSFGEGSESLPTNVTLMVSELDAQKLNHALSGAVDLSARLALSLRSLNDGDDRTIPRPVGDSDMSRLTPPSYFPYLYGEGGYVPQTMELEDTDYQSIPQRADEMEEKPAIAIIRGTRKSIAGATQP